MTALTIGALPMLAAVLQPDADGGDGFLPVGSPGRHGSRRRRRTRGCFPCPCAQDGILPLPPRRRDEGRERTCLPEV